MRPSTLLASLTFRNVGPAVVPLTGLLVGGCVDSLGNDGAADTDSPPDQFSGVKVGGLPLEDWQDAADAFGELWLDQCETVFEIEVDRWQVGTITLDVEIQDPTFAP